MHIYLKTWLNLTVKLNDPFFEVSMHIDFSIILEFNLLKLPLCARLTATLGINF